MDRRASIRAAVVVTLLAAGGCQDYNFNPVGHCLIQPGTKRYTLSNLSTADVLFVVDDSGSMAGEQQSLRDNFTTFLARLQEANLQRVASNLDPIDFHIAITSTAQYRNLPVTGGSTCSSTCSGAAGALVCCQGGTPQPVSCKVNSDCASGFTCSGDCDTDWPAASPACFSSTCSPQRIPCDVAGHECGNLNKYYSFTSCDPSYATGLFTANSEYPAGRFMAAPAGGSDLVLDFDKSLYEPTVNQAAIDALSLKFQQNIQVGTCGSGQETGLDAARLALERVRGAGGLAQTPGYASGGFLHNNAKLVVVWVTDEDDCSAPATGSDAVVFRYTPPADPDVCEVDAAVGGENRQTPSSAYADYFMSLGRPFGAAFIASMTNGCADQNCTAAKCCGANGVIDACGVGICSDNVSCGALNESTRYAALAGELRQRGADVVVGSVCDAFGTSLSRIADIVKPPTGLVLPTQPAASEVTILRIVGKDSKTRTTCRGPAPEALDAAGAAAQGYDWWFTASNDQTTAALQDPSATSQYVYINHGTGACEANFGETYSADYIGQIPAGGCVSEQACADALGGTAENWDCYHPAGFPGTCVCK